MALLGGTAAVSSNLSERRHPTKLGLRMFCGIARQACLLLSQRRDVACMHSASQIAALVDGEVDAGSPRGNWATQNRKVKMRAVWLWLVLLFQTPPHMICILLLALYHR